MTFLKRILGSGNEQARLKPLYRALVAAGRDPFWYREARVPDTLDGRFDMVAAILSLVLLRMERDGDVGRADSVLLTETFIADMDGTLRQIGIGDFVVGKHVGKMMGALGGRLTAFRTAIEAQDFAPAVTRNVFRDAPPSAEAVASASAAFARFHDGLALLASDRLLAGELPTI